METPTPEQKFRVCSAVGEKLRHAPMSYNIMALLTFGMNGQQTVSVANMAGMQREMPLSTILNL